MPYLRSLAVTLAAALGLVACASDAPPQAGDPGTPEIPRVEIGECETAQGEQPPAAPLGEPFESQLREPGILNVGSDNAFPPFEEIRPGEEKPVGFDVDLYTEVAERLGLEAVSTTTEFDGLFTNSVPNGTFDVGVSAITVNEDRKKTVDFTVPYFQADLSLAVNVAETPDIKTIDDLAGLEIGAQKGTTGEKCANFLKKEGKVGDVRSYGDAQLAFQDLLAGRIVAVVNDAPASQGFVDRNAAELAVVQIIETREQYAFAISKEKPDLRVAIDEALTEIMNDGTYATIYEEWFGTAPPFGVPLS